MARKLKSSMIEAAMSLDKKCAYEISQAEYDIQRISKMSDGDLASEAQEHYDNARLFYQKRLTDIHINGGAYEDELCEMLKEYESLILLSPYEWKDMVLANSQNRKEHFEEELAVFKGNNVVKIGTHHRYH